MKIAVFGLGYVGMTAAACLSRDGHEVIGVDVSDEKVAIVNAGKSPITEPGLDELVARAVRKGLLSATKDVSQLSRQLRHGHSLVGSPSAPDGSHNMSFIVRSPIRSRSWSARSSDAVDHRISLHDAAWYDRGTGAPDFRGRIERQDGSGRASLQPRILA